VINVKIGPESDPGHALSGASLDEDVQQQVRRVDDHSRTEVIDGKPAML
jgi:hypothetical protein